MKKFENGLLILFEDDMVKRFRSPSYPGYLNGECWKADVQKELEMCSYCVFIDSNLKMTAIKNRFGFVKIKDIIHNIKERSDLC